MKRCPQCGREYDSSMMFCLDDGAELLYGPASNPSGSVSDQIDDGPQTAILSEPPASAGGQFDVGPIARDSPPYEGGVAAASADGVVLSP